MAKNIKTLPFPDWLLNTQYTVVLYDEGVSEDGEPLKGLTIQGMCIFSEKSKRVIDTQGKLVELIGSVIVKGDIAPSLKTISDGIITINGRDYEIYRAYRPRNPNGTIHHTMFEVK